MSVHFSNLELLDKKTSVEGYKPCETKEDRELLLCFSLHLADISNAAKPWTLCKKWADLLF